MVETYPASYIKSTYLEKTADKLGLEIMGCKFSNPHLIDSDSCLCFTLETKDGRFRECSIEWNNECQLFEIRANDHLITMLSL